MSQRTVMILGATGQLGRELQRVLGAGPQWRVLGLSHTDLEITDTSAVRAPLQEVRPWAVVNCAAFNGSTPQR